MAFGMRQTNPFIYLFAFFVQFLPVACQAAETVHLQYLSDVPVHHTSKLGLEIQESLPILNLTTKGNQVLKFDLFLKNDSGKTPLVKFPLNLVLTLKDIFIFLNVNGEELTFDPRGEKISVPLTQLSQLIDKPMNFQIDAQGLKEQGDTFAKIFKQQPALKNLSFHPFLNEMFFHQFTLCGEELTVGAQFQRTLPMDPTSLLSSTIAYEITEITEQDVTAKMKGGVKPKSLKFPIALAPGAETSQFVEMSLTGDVEGNVTWKRSNAMLYTLNSTYHYQGELKFGEMSWMLQLSMTHAATSALQ